MRYRFYTKTDAAILAMQQAIDRAAHSIALELYILEDDPVGREVLSALVRKAREGVRVYLVLDAIGSFGITQETIEELRSAGAEILFFSHWFRRTHRKLLVVDADVVFLGGVNISRRFMPWRDLQVRMVGRSIGKRALVSFAKGYHACGGTDPELLSLLRRKLLQRAHLWLEEHGLHPTPSLRSRYEHAINEARAEIVLVTPYFIPRRWLLATIHAAIIRGVRVTILVPEHTDISWIDHMNRTSLASFHTIGARCLLSAEMNHAKAMLIDRKRGLIGSHNLDALSFDWNVESSLFFEEQHMVHDLSRIIDSWLATAHPYDPTKEHMKYWEYPLRWVLMLFAPIL